MVISGCRMVGLQVSSVLSRFIKEDLNKRAVFPSIVKYKKSTNGEKKEIKLKKLPQFGSALFVFARLVLF